MRSNRHEALSNRRDQICLKTVHREMLSDYINMCHYFNFVCQMIFFSLMSILQKKQEKVGRSGCFSVIVSGKLLSVPLKEMSYFSFKES